MVQVMRPLRATQHLIFKFPLFMMIMTMHVTANADKAPPTKEACPDVSSCMDVCGEHAAQGKFHASHCSTRNGLGKYTAKCCDGTGFVCPQPPCSEATLGHSERGHELLLQGQKMLEESNSKNSMTSKEHHNLPASKQEAQETLVSSGMAAAAPEAPVQQRPLEQDPKRAQEHENKNLRPMILKPSIRPLTLRFPMDSEEDEQTRGDVRHVKHACSQTLVVKLQPHRRSSGLRDQLHDEQVQCLIIRHSNLLRRHPSST